MIHTYSFIPLLHTHTPTHPYTPTAVVLMRIGLLQTTRGVSGQPVLYISLGSAVGLITSPFCIDPRLVSLCTRAQLTEACVFSFGWNSSGFRFPERLTQDALRPQSNLLWLIRDVGGGEWEEGCLCPTSHTVRHDQQNDQKLGRPAQKRLFMFQQLWGTESQRPRPRTQLLSTTHSNKTI